MLRRPFCGMAVSFLLGIVMAAYGGKWIWLGMLMVAPGTAVLAFWVKRSVGSDKRCAGNVQRSVGSDKSSLDKRCWQLALRVLLCVLMFGGGILRYQEEQAFRAVYQPCLSNGMQLTVQGKLTGKQFKNNQYIYELSACVIMSDQNEHGEMEAVSCNHILMYSDSDEYSIGEILVLDGTIKLWERAVNEGNFDAKSYYESRKIDFAITDVNVRGVYGKKNPIAEGLWELRLRLKEIYRNSMSEETCGVMTTMVLGDKDLLDAEIKQLYQVGGLSHIMAISGLHISVIGMSLYRILRKSGRGFGTAGACAGMLMCFYGTMVGMGTSVQRALIMFLLQLLAAKIGRSYDTLNSLGIAATALLWDNPYLLWDAGFQFSFAAIIGVAWVGRSGNVGELPWRKKWEKLYISVAIQLTTLPLVAWYYYEIPLYALVMNLLILPMMGILLGLGIFGGFGGLIVAKFASVLLYPCQKLLELNEWLCGICGKLPGAMWITGRPEMGQVLLYYGILGAFTMWAYRKKRKQQEVSVENKKQSQGQCLSLKLSVSQSLGMCWKLLGGQIAKFIAAIVLLVIIICVPLNRGFELDILDVGQGDASFLRTSEGYTIFVDGGSSNVSKVGEYRVLPFLKYKGVGQIDCWVVSHTDEDHISGLKEILQMGYPIERLIFSSQVVRDKTLSELLELAENAGTEVAYLEAGDVIHLGKASLQAVFPLGKTGAEETTSAGLGESLADVEELEEEDEDEKTTSVGPDEFSTDFVTLEELESGNSEVDKNASSLVVWYEEEKFSGIFTGDIGVEQEQELAAWLRAFYETNEAQGIDENTFGESGKEIQVDFYKVAHHGSKYSNSEELLGLLRPKIATISCAKKNSYGHPSPEAVANLEGVGCEIFYTMESGQIKVRLEEGGIRVYGLKQE